MIVWVTENHIRKGKECNSGNCPVALALRAVGFAGPKVDGEYFSTLYGLGADIKLPKKVRKFIDRFDRRHELKLAKTSFRPFSFRTVSLETAERLAQG